MLSDKIYSTLVKLLSRLLEDDKSFPIQGRTNFWWWMQKIGFQYKRTFKIPIPLDCVSFMAQ